MGMLGGYSYRIDTKMRYTYMIACNTRMYSNISKVNNIVYYAKHNPMDEDSCVGW